jgi:hypothetical protein
MSTEKELKDIKAFWLTELEILEQKRIVRESPEGILHVILGMPCVYSLVCFCLQMWSGSK